MEQIDYKRGVKVCFANSFEDFKTKIAEYEVKTFTKYIMYTGPKSFTADKVTFSKNSRLHWHEYVGVPYAVPYYHGGTRTYICHQGKDIGLCGKRKYARQRDEKYGSGDGVVRRHNAIHTTKKLDCPATIKCTRMFRMPAHRLEHPFGHRAKEKTSTNIRTIVGENNIIDGEDVFVFNLPGLDDHKNHIIGENLVVTEPVDPQVHKKIIELVGLGHWNAGVIKDILNEYVAIELEKINLHDKQFYPDVQVIRNIINVSKKNTRGCDNSKRELTIEQQRMPTVTHKVIKLEIQPVIDTPLEHLKVTCVDEENDCNQVEMEEIVQEECVVDTMNECLVETISEEYVLETPEECCMVEITEEECAEEITSEDCMEELLQQTPRLNELITNCTTTVNSITSVLWHLDEDGLEILSCQLQNVLQSVSSLLPSDKNAELISKQCSSQKSVHHPKKTRNCRRTHVLPCKRLKTA